MIKYHILNMENLEELLTINEVAEILKVKKREVYRYIKRTRFPLPASQISDETYRVRRQALYDWLSDLAWNGEKL